MASESGPCSVLTLELAVVRRRRDRDQLASRPTAPGGEDDDDENCALGRIQIGERTSPPACSVGPQWPQRGQPREPGGRTDPCGPVRPRLGTILSGAWLSDAAARTLTGAAVIESLLPGGNGVTSVGTRACLYLTCDQVCHRRWARAQHRLVVVSRKKVTPGRELPGINSSSLLPLNLLQNLVSGGGLDQRLHEHVLLAARLACETRGHSYQRRIWETPGHQVAPPRYSLGCRPSGVPGESPRPGPPCRPARETT